MKLFFLDQFRFFPKGEMMISEKKVGVVLSEAFCQPTSKIHFDSLNVLYFQAESIPESTRKSGCHCQWILFSGNSIGSTSSHIYLYTFGFLWPFGIGSSNFYVTSKSDNEKNFEAWSVIFLAHANFKSTFWVCARDALMQCCRINLICQFSSDAAAGQKVVQMDQ